MTDRLVDINIVATINGEAVNTISAQITRDQLQRIFDVIAHGGPFEVKIKGSVSND